MTMSSPPSFYEPYSSEHPSFQSGSHRSLRMICQLIEKGPKTSNATEGKTSAGLVLAPLLSGVGKVSLLARTAFGRKAFLLALPGKTESVDLLERRSNQWFCDDFHDSSSSQQPDLSVCVCLEGGVWARASFLLFRAVGVETNESSLTVGILSSDGLLCK